MSCSSSQVLWSIMIPVANRTAFLANALASLLNQNLDPATTQIEVVDASDTPADFRSIIAGFSQLRIDYFKQARRSIAGNWNTCVQRARNDLYTSCTTTIGSFRAFTKRTATTRDGIPMLG